MFSNIININDSILYNITSFLPISDIANIRIAGIETSKHILNKYNELYIEICDLFHSRENNYEYYECEFREHNVLHVFHMKPFLENSIPIFKILPFKLKGNISEYVITFQEYSFDNSFASSDFMYNICVHAKCIVESFSYWKSIELNGVQRKDLELIYDFIFENDNIKYSDITRNIFEVLKNRCEYETIPTMKYGSIADALIDISNSGLCKSFASNCIDNEPKKCLQKLVDVDDIIKIEQTNIFINPIHYYNKYDKSIIEISNYEGWFELEIHGPVPAIALSHLYACVVVGDNIYSNIRDYIEIQTKFIFPEEPTSIWRESNNVMDYRIFNDECKKVRPISLIPHSVKFTYEEGILYISINGMKHTLKNQLYMYSFERKIHGLCNACLIACTGSKEKLSFKGNGHVAITVIKTINALFDSKHNEFEYENITSGVFQYNKLAIDLWKHEYVSLAEPLNEYLNVV